MPKRRDVFNAVINHCRSILQASPFTAFVNIYDYKKVPESLHWPALLSCLKHNIMEVVYDWAKGSKFYEIMEIVVFSKAA
ncbi:unnamed protein product [Brassica oleracea]